VPGSQDNTGTQNGPDIVINRGVNDDILVILPVNNTVLFPELVLPVRVDRKKSVAALQRAMQDEAPLGLLLQRDPRMDNPLPEELYEIGTRATVLRYVTEQVNQHHLVCQGQRRFRIVEFLETRPLLKARVEYPQDTDVAGKDVEAWMVSLQQGAQRALELLPDTPAEVVNALHGIRSPGLLADAITGHLDLQPAQKQEVLELLDVRARMERVHELLNYRIEVLQLSRKISDRTEASMNERQRHALLREQMQSIQRELGDVDEYSQELRELEQKIFETHMPIEVESQALKELRRLERMPEAAAEQVMARTYLDVLTELPWNALSDSPIDIKRAREMLDQDHYGLETVKRRILEHLAVQKLNPEGKSPIICFAGPPGVGKTSLGQSIARAMGREFVRASVGGVHDEAEIRGHRRTYVGALPGNIIQGIRKAGTRNPVFMLDELDKLGQGARGDPASALLEVLDPEQNNSFRDNYLAVPFDLSKVMFIGTANVMDQIPGPLRDRMEVIDIPGYTAEEKVEIARRFMLARNLQASGLSEEQCRITRAALAALVDGYTREAGCRNLDRLIGAVTRHVAVQVAEGSISQATVDEPDLHAILGPRRYENEVALRTVVPGVATGLAWTAAGGDILFIEASRSPGTGRLILTGQLGDVMKESAQAALTLVKSRASGLGLDPGMFERSDIHVHVPAGAIPKDGPSAGVCIYAALISLLMNRCVREDVAMTGEITLRGLVLPVGGIKEKALAALRAGIQTVLLPARNRKDFEDIPEKARKQLTIHWVERLEDVQLLALTPEVFRGKQVASRDVSRDRKGPSSAPKQP